ncbi:hypothetical protein E5675_15285 [Sphingopyxis sp. PAMC25046]|uniref:hypothetical protein n=1 Tax=Sphingopyxis sp. PAMC25046 TaxID=2565556 RepID=UPI00109D9B41|nr:hypothetical protein [Sphingopyxis sp. PAMC25046]QCB55662.1 hypothetical protein E5675_15285 [Sphingopyxis sp. PAMC25046]
MKRIFFSLGALSAAFAAQAIAAEEVKKVHGYGDTHEQACYRATASGLRVYRDVKVLGFGQCGECTERNRREGRYLCSVNIYYEPRRG